MDSYWLDLRYTLRSLRAQPGFAVTVALTLALGLGACIAVFSLVNALSLRPLPGLTDVDGLVAIQTEEADGPGASSYVDFLELRGATDAFSSLAAFKPRPMDLGLRRTSQRVTGLMVSGSYFETLGVTPTAGRFFDRSVDRSVDRTPEGMLGAKSANDAFVAVLGHDLWLREFGGSRDAVGRTIALNGRDFTVVGVAPRDFRGTMFDALPDVFVPITHQPHFMPGAGDLLERPGWTGLWIVGRLAEGASEKSAQTQLTVVAERLRQDRPETHAKRRFQVVSLAAATIPPAFRGSTLGMSALLMACMTLFLLVACVNVANLLLARSARRSGELAMRQALGASRGRIVRQLLMESAGLSLVGCAGGLLLASWARDAFRLIPLPALDPQIDGRVVAFSLGLALLTALGFGLAPALRGARLDLTTLRAGRDVVPGRLRAGGVFVVLQVAMSVVLLLVAGLFLRTLLNLTTADLGLSAENVLVGRLDPALQRYDGDRLVTFYEQVLEGVESLPGVTRASITSSRPGGGEGDSLGYFLEGVESAAGDSEKRVDGSLGFAMVGVDYFRTLEIPVRRGRIFSGDDRSSSPPVLVLNESAARSLRASTGRPALGTRVSFSGAAGPWVEVVGVVGDSATGSLRSGIGPFAYAAHAQAAPLGFDWPMSLVVRTEVPPLSVVPALRDAVRRVDPYLPTTDVTTLEGYVFGDALVLERLTTWALGLAGLVALLMAALGLFGVVSYSVSRRAREIGIRRALGARSGELKSMVVRQGMGLVTVGLALGLAAGLAAGHAVDAILFGLSGTDPLTAASVVVLLSSVAFLACWLPARRAARVDPVETLRAD